jgi:hypothetical protein
MDCTSKTIESSEEALSHIPNLKLTHTFAWQISTGQFEGMQPIGVQLLCLIMDKVAQLSFSKDLIP